MLQTFLNFQNTWNKVRDGSDTAREIFDRHYSRRFYRDGRKPKKFVGPGERMILLTADSDALFVWRKFISDNGQQGVPSVLWGVRLSISRKTASKPSL